MDGSSRGLFTVIYQNLPCVCVCVCVRKGTKILCEEIRSPDRDSKAGQLTTTQRCSVISPGNTEENHEKAELR